MGKIKYPTNAYTLEEEIQYGKNQEISHDSTQLKVCHDDIIHGYTSIYAMYYYILKPYIVKRTLTKSEFNKYYQKPKLLCMDFYGTPELWSGILYINNMISVSDFTKQTLNLFTNNIQDILSEIKTIYRDDFDTNKTEIYKED